MAQQLDLLARAGLRLEAESGRTDPRLWVRRLVVWSEPGVVLREVRLRPGLNIVWSPDPTDSDTTGDSAGALGHGSGKTLFCRLLRYCLGEERFAPDSQRDRIALAFKDGLVGAEVVVDGVVWAVVRSIGLARQNTAIRGGDLDALAAGPGESTGMGAFLEAVETQILSDNVAALVSGERARKAWLVALAWLSRDQECRFDDVLAWRSTASDSGSPARGLSTMQTLDALRALIGAITPEEHALRAEVSELEQLRGHAEREEGHRVWEAAQKRTGLASALGLRSDELPPGPLVVDVLRKAARGQLARVASVDPATEVVDLGTLRAAWDAARQNAEDLARESAEIGARIPEIERHRSFIRSELPGLSVSIHESEHPLCPICEVPIDRALAEGCKLSHKLPDLGEVRKREGQRQRELSNEQQRLHDAQQRQGQIEEAIGAAQMYANELHQRLQALEHARDDRKDAWYTARRLIDDAEQLSELFGAREEVASRAAQLATMIEKKREQAAICRDNQARVFQRFTQIFDAIIREIVGSQAEGRVTLDGNGLHLAVELGGERSTAAIDSLKVLAFDLAALCMSIEGATHVPAFLVHDSPREADLGLSAYNRLFHLARSLEKIEDRPLFQYIVTTTTRPPEELRMAPWLCLTVQGAPAKERLLMRDL